MVILTNQAAWLDAPGSPLRVGPVEAYEPEKGEVLIRAHALAINPVDAFMQKTGMLIENFPFIAGSDLAGTVVRIGEGVTHVRVGSRVVALQSALLGQKRAAFQLYSIASELVVVPIPDEISFVDASVIPLAFLTAGAGLYMKTLLALPLPTLNPQKGNKSILIWGGATSVGTMAIQLAIASGLNVYSTASPKNFDFVKSLGATEVFDYNSESVEQDIKAALDGKDTAGIYEASGIEDSMKKAANILSLLGGGKLVTVREPPENMPANVSATFIYSLHHLSREEDSARQIWQNFLPEALKTGQFKPLPQAEVAGKGLEGLQAGLDAWKRGVSAKKVVVEI